jgi:hypothetical protein
MSNIESLIEQVESNELDETRHDKLSLAEPVLTQVDKNDSLLQEPSAPKVKDEDNGDDDNVCTCINCDCIKCECVKCECIKCDCVKCDCVKCECINCDCVKCECINCDCNKYNTKSFPVCDGIVPSEKHPSTHVLEESVEPDSHKKETINRCKPELKCIIC